MNNEQETSLLNLLRDKAQAMMPAGSSVWLYGSRARGDQHQNSDWDLLILLDKSKIDDDDFAQCGYPFIELGWTMGADVSPQLYTIQEWMARKNTPFYQNVNHDKKIIYGA